MLRSLAVAVSVLLALAAPALAAVPPPAGEFANADCSSPRFEAYILARLGRGKNMFSGQQMATRFDYGPITDARTISNTGTTITCEISVDFSPGQSGTHLIRGRFTAIQHPGGGDRWRWLPGS